MFNDFLKNKSVLLCVSASVAFYKAYEILSLLKKAGADVRVALSENALKFTSDLGFEALSGHKVLCFKNESWANGISHIQYAKSDLIIIAPATANTISKIASGIADNPMLDAILASNAPKILAPAMNVKMLENPATQNSLQTLKDRGFCVLDTMEKCLACGDFGKGALPDLQLIIKHAIKELKKDSFWEKKSVLITGGATSEKIDDVRAITNFSSGKMAFYLAYAYFFAGANVSLISSNSYENLPFESLHFTSSAQLLERINSFKLKSDDLLIMAAAVSDFVPLNAKSGKIKKTGQNLLLELTQNIDILSSIKLKCKKIGFKMEMDEKIALKNAKQMLDNKGLDAVCLNILDEKNYFGSEQNEIEFISKNASTHLALNHKMQIASQIVELSKRL